MTWVLVAAGLLALGVFATFGWALCITAARADEAFDRERDRLRSYPRLEVVDELHRHVKRPGDVSASRGSTER